MANELDEQHPGGHRAILKERPVRLGKGGVDQNRPLEFMVSRQEHQPAARLAPPGIGLPIGRIAACVQHLRADGVTSVFTVGFCFGGRNSWLASAAGHDLAGAIGFYGRPGPANDGTPGPIQRAGEMRAPVLALQGGDDPGIPVEDSQAFDRALSEAGVEHEVVIYEGAPHSFFDRKYEEFAAASEDAWNRALAFLARYA